MKQVLLFDFDGTLTKKDTLLEIAKYSTSNKLQYFVTLARVLPFILLVKFKLISNQKSKELFLKLFFGNTSRSNFDTICTQFARDVVPSLIRPLALYTVQNYQSSDHKMCIVSASPENWIKPWAEQYGIEVIATKLKFENDRLKGIDGINCNGEEKVRRIKEVINLDEFDKVIAYGDTKGDLPMLALADEKHFKPFR